MFLCCLLGFLGGTDGSFGCGEEVAEGEGGASVCGYEV